MGDYGVVIEVVDVFVKTVLTLTETPALAAGKKLYIHDPKRNHIHFRAGDFKKVLSGVIPQKSKQTELMKHFRTLQFIICESNRFTNSRYINGKTTRVITIDLAKYTLLKEIIRI